MKNLSNIKFGRVMALNCTCKSLKQLGKHPKEPEKKIRLTIVNYYF